MNKPRYSSYMICTSPRSGSTLLCALLKKTGRAGAPDSHFHAPSISRWIEDYRLSTQPAKPRTEALRSVFASAIERGKGGTEMFGLRMQRGSFPYFIEQIGYLVADCANDIERIQTAFGPTLFVHLHRADKLAQAVSRVVAEQSGLWHRAADGTELERLAAPGELHFDRQTIARHMAEFASMDSAWEDWFALEGVKPWRISYDELAKDPQGTLARLLAVLGLDPRQARRIETPTARLADATSKAWIERFRKLNAE
ncbi:MAG: Stf0 family sulfotransferase [Geminicoccaceae bacterium]